MKKPVPEWEGLRTLVEVVKGKIWGWEWRETRRVGEKGEGENAAVKGGVWEMVKEVGRRNAVMVAGWQAWGFMHGELESTARRRG